jgi:hypothetical protein
MPDLKPVWRKDMSCLKPLDIAQSTCSDSREPLIESGMIKKNNL